MAPRRWAAALVAALAIAGASCSSSGNPSGGGLEARADLDALLERCAELERPGGMPCLSADLEEAGAFEGAAADVPPIAADAQTICDDIASTDPDRVGELVVSEVRSATFDPSEPGIACIAPGILVSVVIGAADEADEADRPCEPDDRDQPCQERADGSREYDLKGGEQATTSRSWPNGDGLFVSVNRFGDDVDAGPVSSENDDLRVDLVDTLARSFDLGQ